MEEGEEPIGWKKTGNWNGLHLGGWGCYRFIIAFPVISNRHPQNKVLKTGTFLFLDHNWRCEAGARAWGGSFTRAPATRGHLLVPLRCCQHGFLASWSQGDGWSCSYHSCAPGVEKGKSRWTKVENAGSVSTFRGFSRSPKLNPSASNVFART